MPDCTCEMPPEMSQAGRAAPLCHHSSTAALEDAQQSLSELSTYFSHQIAVDELFQIPMRTVADQYATAIVGGPEHYEMITETEYLIITAAFLRQASILLQDLQVSLYLRIARQRDRDT